MLPEDRLPQNPMPWPGAALSGPVPPDPPLPGFFDLQRFAEDDERSEPATPRRREEARERGQVAKTAELGTALVLLGGALALRRTLGGTLGAMQDLLAKGLSGQLLPWDEFTHRGVVALFQHLTWEVGLLVLPVALAAAAGGLVSQLVQTGFLFSTYPLEPRLDRLDPIAGMRRIFSRRALVELGKALAKVAVVGGIAYTALRGNVSVLPHLMETAPVAAAHWVGETVWRVAVIIGGALLLIALLDYAYQRAEYEQSLKMTPRQVKEELRQTEGDPLVRRRIRERQRQVAARRMMQQVPTADVVITNPVHLAVALKYEMATMEAPQVVAKGSGYIAQRIREVAEEHSVPVVRDVWLARALYEGVDIGHEVPEHLYQAVARVLAFVYRLRRGGSREPYREVDSR